MRLIYIVVIIMAIFMSACLKDIENNLNNNSNSDSPLTENSFEQSFNWQSAITYHFSITTNQSMMIEIKSINESQLFHKGFFTGKDSLYLVSLSLPSYYQQISINDQIIDLTGNNINVELEGFVPGFKSGTASKGIVSYWAMDEGTGSMVQDDIGENTGTVFNASWAQGISGSALEFDGTQGMVLIPEADNLDIIDEITLSAWVKTYENKESKIAQKGDWDGYNLGMGKWTGWKGSIRTIDENSHSVEWDQGIPLMNEWYFLAMTFDGSVLKLYVNGTLRDSNNISGPMHNNNRDFTIGSDNNSQKFFNGIIDEVAVYDHALDANEIQNIYNVMPNSDSDGDGVPDFQDDYPFDYNRAFNNFFPGEYPGSMAFEDLWPGLGDFDFNDLVLDFRFQTVTNANNFVCEVFGEFTLKAVGASNRNGFGFQLGQNFPENQLLVSGTFLTEGIISNNANGTESGQDKSTIIVFDNTYKILESAGGTGVNVDPEAPYVDPVTLNVLLDFEDNLYNQQDIDIENLNPFLIINKERGREVHLANHPPTALADPTYFGTSQDDSDPAMDKFYKTKNNVPWAIMLPEPFDYPREKTKITDAHLKFMDWALSGGASLPDWYHDNPGYRNSGAIFSTNN